MREVEEVEASKRGTSFVKFLPVILFFVAFGLRLIGIGWGLPNDLHNQSYHPDEQVIFAYSQQIEPAKAKFTPGFYNYGTLYLTVLRVASDVVAGYGGGPDRTRPESVWQYMARCHLAGRVISAVAGSAAVVFVFLILRRFVNPLGSVAGALILAFAPSFVVHSRFQTVDVLATALLAASLWYSIRVFDDARPDKCALWAGVFAGLSTGTKYTGVLALFVLVAAVAMRKESLWKSLGIGVGAWAVAFVVATPGALLETSAFLRDVKYEMLHTSTGHGLVFQGVGSGFLYHLTNLFQSFGPVALLLAIAGLVRGAIAKERKIWALLAFAIPYMLLIGRAEVLFIRYTFPLLLVLAIGFGWIVGRGHDRKGLAMALPAAGILGLGLALMITSGFTSRMVGAEPRDVVAQQLKALPDSENVTVGLVADPWFYSPALFPDSAIMRGQLDMQLAEMEAVKPRVLRYLPGDPADRYDWDVRLLNELKPSYVAFSNFEVAHVARLSETVGKYIEVDRFKEFHQQLELDYELEGPASKATSLKDRYSAAGLVEDMAYVRPLLYIWKRKS